MNNTGRRGRSPSRRMSRALAAVTAALLLGVTWVGVGPAQAQSNPPAIDPPAEGTKVALPGQPTYLLAGATYKSVSLVWKAPSDGGPVEGYRIWRRNLDVAGSSLAVLVDDTGSTAASYDDTSVSASTRYSYRVQAVNSRGAGPISMFVNATTGAMPPPGRTQYLDVSATSGGSTISAWWDPVGGQGGLTDRSADSYKVEWRRFTDGSIPEGNLIETTEAAAEITVDGAGKWVVRVRACNANGCGSAVAKAVDVTFDEPPTITGGGATHNYAENGTAAVATYTASDPNDDAISWSVEGTDAGEFAIGADGALSFAAAPDFESPADADGDNVYALTVKATANGKSATLGVSVTVTDVDEPLAVSGSADVSIDENATDLSVGTYAAVNLDGQATVAWSLEGTDAAHFVISAAGALAMRAAQDFESPADADGDNAYEVTVKATAGNETATLPVTVSVAGVNEAPYFIWKYSRTEHVTDEGHGLRGIRLDGNYGAEDPEGTLVTFTITGADGDKFRRYHSWVERKTSHFLMDLASTSNLDYENPLDANGDNVYEFTINASDGALSTPLHVTLTVQDVNEMHTLAGPSGVSFASGGTGTVATYTVTDPDGQTIPLTLSGADAGSFSISDGALTFKTAPNHQTKSSYSVTVTAADDDNTVSKDVTVLVVDSQDAMTVSGPGSFSVNENSKSLTLGSYVATASGGGQISWSVEGSDATSFAISSDGELSLASSPNFEDKSSYSAKVKATAGTASVNMNVTVAVVDVNEPPAVVGPKEVSFANGGTGVVATYSAIDPDEGQTASLLLERGDADNDSFNLDSTTGELTFKSPPDYLTKSSYTVSITAEQYAPGYGATYMDVTVTILPDPLVVSGRSASKIAERTTDLSLGTYTVNSLAGETVAWSLEGDDAGDFAISAAGVLSLSAVPDFEAPADADRDNTYAVTVKATAGTRSATLAVTVQVTDVDETSVPGRVAGLSTTATHSQATLSWRAPGDGGLPTNYQIWRRNLDVRGSSLELIATTADASTTYTDTSVSASTRYSYRVRALNGRRSGPISPFSNVTTAATPPPVRVTGLSLSATPNKLEIAATWNAVLGSEALKVPGADTYRVEWIEWDRFAKTGMRGGSRLDTADTSAKIAVAAAGKWVVEVRGCNTHGCGLMTTKVLDVAEPNYPPYFIQEKTALEVDEGYGGNLHEYGIKDPEGDAFTITLHGPDKAVFSIQNRYDEGAVHFAALYLYYREPKPDFETPKDANGDNVYEVTMRIADADGHTDLDVSVTVNDVNEAPALTGPSGVSFPSGGTGTVATYAAADPEGATIDWTLGGTDAASFTLAGGALAFTSAPDHQTKSAYEVTISVSDGTHTVSRDVLVTVADSQATMTVSGEGSYSVYENTTALTLGSYTATASGGGQVTWSLEGDDATSFAISAAGELSLASSPNHEANSSLSAKVKATAGTASVTMNVTVEVTDVDEPPAVIGPNVVSFASGGTGVVATFSAEDPDEGETAELALEATDADNDSFNLDTTTGELTFKSPPDYDTKSTYKVILTAERYTPHYTARYLHVTINIVPPQSE